MPNPHTEEKLRKLASRGRRKADLDWLFYLSSEGEERQSADELLDILLFQKVSKGYKEQIFLNPPPQAECRGPYALGTVVYPPGKPYAEFGLREDEWIKHLLIVGMSGTGKTNLAFHVLRELKKKAKPFMVFDWKRNYRDLLQLPDLRDTLVFTVGKDASPFGFNPLIPPPGTEPGQWLMKLVDVLKHAYFVGEGVEYFLRQAIDSVYEECGFLDGSRTAVPLFFQVRDHVQKKRVQGRMMLWKASALRVLESLCFRHGLGPVVNTNENWDHQRLLSSSVVLELDGLSDSDKWGI